MEKKLKNLRWKPMWVSHLGCIEGCLEYLNLDVSDAWLFGVFSNKSRSDFAEKQKLAWEMVKQAIDEGLPCYGLELDIPEFYVVYGYDDEGYYFSGPRCDSGKGPKPWKELGDTGIGVLEISCE